MAEGDWTTVTVRLAPSTMKILAQLERYGSLDRIVNGAIRLLHDPEGTAFGPMPEVTGYYDKEKYRRTAAADRRHRQEDR